ncbi:Phosphotransferase enzyme family protein [compost metagenome]
MEIEQILKELNQLNILKNPDCRVLSGGTSSAVFAVYKEEHPYYVIKINQASMIESESTFLEQYVDIELLPRVVYVDPASRYLVYYYKPGSTRYVKGNKQDILISLVKNLINTYKPCDIHGYGYIDNPVDSWREFLLGEADEAKKIIADTLKQEEHDLIYNLINSMGESKIKYLIHGDCGVHNFIFTDGRMTGVIDPTPISGEPLYDLIYAFCSSPDELSYSIIVNAVHALDNRLQVSRNLDEEVIKGLYLRMATCIMHHPSDLNAYLDAWGYWKQRILNMKKD